MRGRLSTRPPGKIVVFKFGSSLLAGPDGFRVAAAEVVHEVRTGCRVVAVCSAQRGVTDALVGAAATLVGVAGAPHGAPPDALLTRLLATGECASVAFLAMAVASCGVAVQALDGAALGVRTRGDLLDAEPVDVDAAPLLARLREHPVLVVPGFVGVDAASGEPSLLGRGGSDLTALFLAHRLGAADCRLVKDVDGLFPYDPRDCPGQSPLGRATWEQVLEVGGGVVQEKALHFARRWGCTFRIVAPRGRGTVVGPMPEPTARPCPA